MIYAETLDYLFTQLPMYQRQGGAAYKANLDNTHALMNLLGNPEKDLKCVHVAGTNGKGSVSHMLASTLQEAGYKVGLYTSPHLLDFRERIKINGQEIGEHEVVDFVAKYRNKWETISPSFFEMTVAMAFWHFTAQKTDINIIEVGMGGRLDSTNVVTPEVSVITNIGLDHTQFLGNTLAEIAGEKGGIIKPKIPIVIGETNSETRPVFIDLAHKKAAPIRLVEDYSLRTPPAALLGEWQNQNADTAFLALQMLAEAGWTVGKDHIKAGFANVVTNTGLQGRYQKVQESPLVICDGGHNAAGIAALTQQIEKEKFDQLHIVLGMVNDKDVATILNLWPDRAHYYFCKPQIARGLPAEDLLKTAKSLRLKGNAYTSVSDAYTAALQNAAKTDLIFVGGSFFVVADLLTDLKDKIN